MPDITIFIRARNEAARISQCLEQVFSQKTDYACEVIILDCESSDKTVECARAFPVTIFSIPPSLFTYSAALNFGVMQARGSFFVPLSAHAVPADNLWLAQLVTPLVSDTSIGASFSRQLPWPEASTPEVETLLNVFPEEATTCRWQDLSMLGAEEVYRKVLFSNVSSCIRTEILKAIPFREIPFSEDRFFALECLKAGYAIHYAPTSRIFHLHAPSRSESTSVTKRAMVSKSLILEFMNPRQLTLHWHVRALRSLAMSLMKMGAFPFWFALMCSRAKSKREVCFYWAQLGVILGKWQAALQMLKSIPKIPTIANPNMLLEKAKQL